MLLFNQKNNNAPVREYPGTDKYNIRTLLESSDEKEEEALWEFVKLKCNSLYQECEKDDRVRLPLEKPLVPMTPIEVFQKPPCVLRRQMFFKSLDRGDIMYFRVVNESYDSYKLLALARHQGCWKIDDLSIVMYLPKYQQEMKLLDSFIGIGFLIRAALCSCSLKERRLLVTLDNSIVKTEFKAVKLGKMSEFDLPHYIGSPFLGISYTDYMFTTTEFRYKNWSRQFACLGLDKKAVYSHFDNLEKKKYSQFESVSHLKMKQNVLLSQSYYFQGLHSFEEGLSEIAMAHLDNAVTVCAENMEALLLRGRLHSSLGNLRQAFIDTEKAVRLDPLYEPARKQMAIFLVDAAKVHVDQGNDFKARESLAMARGLDASNEEACIPIDEIREQLKKSYNEDVLSRQKEYVEPIPIPAIYLQYKKKSKKHHRKRSRHQHHKRSKPKSPLHPMLFPERKSPIPQSPALPCISAPTQPGRLPFHSCPIQKTSHSSFTAAQKSLLSSLSQTSSYLPLVQEKPPFVSPTFRSIKAHPSFLQKSPVVDPTGKSSLLFSQINLVHDFYKQSSSQFATDMPEMIDLTGSPPHSLCQSRSSEDQRLISQNWNKRTVQDFCGSKLPSQNWSKRTVQDFCGSKLPPQDIGRSRSPSRGLGRSRSPPQGFCRSRSPPQGLCRSRSPPRGLHKSRSPKQDIYGRSTPQSLCKSTSPALHKSRSLHRNLCSSSPHWGHMSRSQSPKLDRNRSPSLDHYRSGSSSIQLCRSRSSSSDLRKNRAPSSDLRKSMSPLHVGRSRSSSQDLHKSPPPSLCRSMLSLRGLRKSRSSPRNLYGNRSPSQDFHRKRSPYTLRKSKSPPQVLRRSKSPSRALRWSRSPPRALRRSKSPSRALRRSKSPSRALRRSKSPPRVRRRSSKSPPRAHRRSKSPPRARRRSKSPHRARRRSKSPIRARRRSPRHRSKSPPRAHRRSKSPPQDFHRNRSPPRSHPKSRSPPQSFHEDKSYGHSKRLLSHDISNSSSMHDISEMSQLHGLLDRSKAHPPDSSLIRLLKRGALIKSILEKRLKEPTSILRTSPSQDLESRSNNQCLPEWSPQQEIPAVSSWQGLHDRPPTNENSLLNTWSIPTISHSWRSPSYNSPLSLSTQSLNSSSIQNLSEQSIPTVFTQRRPHKSQFSFRKITEF